jgi:hypothetical protein
VSEPFTRYILSKKTRQGDMGIRKPALTFLFDPILRLVPFAVKAIEYGTPQIAARPARA